MPRGFLRKSSQPKTDNTKSRSSPFSRFKKKRVEEIPTASSPVPIELFPEPSSSNPNISNNSQQLSGKSNSPSIDKSNELSGSLQWAILTPTPQTPTPRQVHGSCIVNNSMYVFGGIGSNSSSTTAKIPLFNDLICYKFDSESWFPISIPALQRTPNYQFFFSFFYLFNHNHPHSYLGPCERYCHTMTSFNDKFILVYGGLGSDAIELNDFYVFDTINLSWMKPVLKGIPPPPLWGHSAVLSGNFLVLFGGYSNSIASSRLYSIDLLSWEIFQIKTTIEPPPRAFHTSALYGGSMFIFGGQNTSSTVISPQIWQFQFATQEWKTLPAQGIAPYIDHGHSAVISKNFIIFYGPGTSPSTNISCFSFEATCWVPITPLDFGNTISPTRFHSAVNYDEILYIFGGIDSTDLVTSQFCALDLLPLGHIFSSRVRLANSSNSPNQSIRRWTDFDQYHSDLGPGQKVGRFQRTIAQFRSNTPTTSETSTSTTLGTPPNNTSSSYLSSSSPDPIRRTLTIHQGRSFSSSNLREPTSVFSKIRGWKRSTTPEKNIESQQTPHYRPEDWDVIFSQGPRSVSSGDQSAQTDMMLLREDPRLSNVSLQTPPINPLNFFHTGRNGQGPSVSSVSSAPHTPQASQTSQTSQASLSTSSTPTPQVRFLVRFGGENRQFRMPREASYDQLCSKIREKFPHLQKFVIQYNDDGDSITIRSQEDFEEYHADFIDSLEINSKAKLKLNILEQPSSSPSSSTVKSPTLITVSEPEGPLNTPLEDPTIQQNTTGVLPNLDSTKSSRSSSGASHQSSISHPPSPMRRPSPNSRRPSASNRTGMTTDVVFSVPARWQKGEVLGQGGYGKVYQGLDLDTGQFYAVKCVELKSNTEKEKKKVAALESEIKLLSGLIHPNIVAYAGTSKDSKHLNIFLEYVPGGSISSMLNDFGWFSEKIAAKFTKQLLRGISYLHSNGIIHRDIKGANILVDVDGTVRVADFGASRKLNLDVTATGEFKDLKGTPYWMAPEVIKQSGHGRKADIWSVGCTVIEMVTGEPPLCDIEPLTALFQIAKDSYTPEIPPFLSKNAQDFLHLCFQRNPAERPNSDELLKHPFLCLKMNPADLDRLSKTQAEYLNHVSSTSHSYITTNSTNYQESTWVPGASTTSMQVEHVLAPSPSFENENASKSSKHLLPSQPSAVSSIPKASIASKQGSLLNVGSTFSPKTDFAEHLAPISITVQNSPSNEQPILNRPRDSFTPPPLFHQRDDSIQNIHTEQFDPFSSSSAHENDSNSFLIDQNRSLTPSIGVQDESEILSYLRHKVETTTSESL